MPITNTQKSGNTWLHFIEGDDAPSKGEHVTVEFDRSRRNAIQRHHSVTHLLHWALHEVVSKEATQKGSFVGPDKLTFDFNSVPLTAAIDPQYCIPDSNSPTGYDGAVPILGGGRRPARVAPRTYAALRHAFAVRWLCADHA